MLESRVRSMCSSGDASATPHEPPLPSARSGRGGTLPAWLSAVVNLGADGAHVAVHGELDVSTAPQLTVVLDAVAAQEPAAIVIDLAQLDFIDGAGLWAIARAAGGVGVRHVHVRHASPLTRRLFSIGGLHDLLDGPVDDDRVSVRRERVDEAMIGVVALLEPAIVDLKGVSVTLRRDEHLVTAAADSPLGRELDRVQYDAGEGPCVEASVQGTQVTGELPRDGARWPRFAATGAAHGIHGIVSTAIVVDGEPVGAINVYLERPVLREEDRMLPQLAATHAATVLAGIATSADGG